MRLSKRNISQIQNKYPFLQDYYTALNSTSPNCVLDKPTQ